MKLIDFEHHFYTQETLDFMYGGEPHPRKPTDILELLKPGSPFVERITALGEERIQVLDDAGVDIALLSSSMGIEELSDMEGVPRIIQNVNDAVYQTVQAYPERFWGSITLPVLDLEAAQEELRRCVEDLGFVTWHTHSNYGETAIDDDRYLPLLQQAADYGVPVYIHPHTTKDTRILGLGPAVATAGFGYSVDVMTTAIGLITKGVLDRIPHLKIVLGHLGEFFPYILDRMDNRLKYFKDDSLKNQHLPSHYFENGNFYLTTSGCPYNTPFQCAVDRLGPEYLLFGSDYPYEDLKEGADFIRFLSLEKGDKEKVGHLNAEKLVNKTIG